MLEGLASNKPVISCRSDFLILAAEHNIFR